MSIYSHLDLFSGIGGFALAARWAGLQTVQFVEIDKFCQKVLQKNFPGVRIHDDIKTFTDADYNRCKRQKIPIQSRKPRKKGDVLTRSNQRPLLLTAGVPCQTASCAGLRHGETDFRWLWPETIGIIKHIKPSWIILENVLGITSLVKQFGDIKVESKTIQRLEASDYFRRVFTRQEVLLLGKIIQDIEAAGYDLPESTDGTPIIPVIPACAVNAPHRRDRVWIVANSTDYGLSRPRPTRIRELSAETREGLHDRLEQQNCHAPDTDREGSQGSERAGTHDEGQTAHKSTAERNYAWQEPWLEAAQRFCKLDDGLPAGLDGRGMTRNKYRVQKLKSLGNAVVPQVAYEIMKAILAVEVEVSNGYVCL